MWLFAVLLCSYAAPALTARVQTVALSMRQVSGESPLSIMIESDLCSTRPDFSATRAPMHEVVLVVQSSANVFTPGGVPEPALLLDNDHVSELSVMQRTSQEEESNGTMLCLARLCEKRPLASRRSSVSLHGRRADFVRFGCASHGRRSAHGIISGPCEGALDIGVSSEIWNNFRHISLSHNRLLLSVNAGGAGGRLCESSSAHRVHMCRLNASAGVRDSRTSEIALDLGRVQIDVDFSSPLHRIDTRLFSQFASIAKKVRGGAQLAICIGRTKTASTCETTVIVPLHEPSDYMYEGSLVTLDDDDDVVALDENALDRRRRRSSDTVAVFVAADFDGKQEVPRIVLGSLLLRHYATSFALHANGTRTASFELHQGRGNLTILEALVFICAIAHLAASVCFSAELTGDSIARRVAKQTRSAKERHRMRTARGIHLFMVFWAIVVASSCAYLLSQRATREGLIDESAPKQAEFALWCLLAFGVLVAALAPAAYAAGTKPGPGARTRTIVLLSLAYEQIAFVALLLVTSVWHEGGPFESLSSALVALCLIGNSARHAQHAVDLRVALPSTRTLPFACLDVLVFGALLMQTIFICRMALLPVTNASALALVLVIYAVRSGVYVARVNVDAAINLRLHLSSQSSFGPLD